MNPLRARWQKEQFDPGWLGWLVNPFVIARRGLRRELAALLPRLGGDVVDVGCGRKPYRDLVAARSYVGVDVDTPVTRALGIADRLYDGRTLPLGDASCDGALCSQVLEHVFTPDDFLREIARVLRPGGHLVLAVPFAWDEHEQPHDFARYSSFGLRALLERNGFTVLEQRKSGAHAGAVAQLAAAWLFKATRSRHRALNLIAQLAFIAPVNLVGGVAGALLPRSEDFYLDNVVLAQRGAPAPLVRATSTAAESPGPLAPADEPGSGSRVGAERPRGPTPGHAFAALERGDAPTDGRPGP